MHAAQKAVIFQGRLMPGGQSVKRMSPTIAPEWTQGPSPVSDHRHSVNRPPDSEAIVQVLGF